MPHWLFTEDINGKYGCLGWEDSEVRARMKKDEYDGIVYIKKYKTYDRGTAKRLFRGEMMKKRGLEHGYKNVHNLDLVGVEED